MRDFENYFELPLDNIQVGKPKQLKFFDDGLKRLIGSVDNGSPFVELVQPTQLAYDNLEKSLSETNTSSAQQHSRTLSVDSIIETFIDLISKREAAIRVHFDKNSPEYLEFFPQGITQYFKATKANVKILMDQMCVAIENKLVILGQPLLDEFKLIRADFVKARDLQEKKKGATDENRGSWDDNIIIMKKQFHYNLLTIAREYPGQPEKAKMFFDQSILRLPNHNNGSEENKG